MRLTPLRALAGGSAVAAIVCASLLPSRAQTAQPIAPGNVSRLEVAWTYDTRDSTEPVRPGRKSPAFEATPVYADGRLYVSTPYGTVAAIDAATGKEVWRTDLAIDRDADYSEFTDRGPALAGDRLFVGTVDARLVCLERKDGSRCQGFGRDGQIDLRQGLRRPPQYAGEYGVSSPAAVYRDLVIVGSFVADNSRAQMASGEVRAFDARTGALRWTFHPLPADAPAGGANTWSRIVVDDENGLVLLPTGSASPDYFGGLRASLQSGKGSYDNSLVVLRAATGEVAWHFQTVHHDLWDYDVASPPLLFPGKGGPAVAIGSKTGHLFLFDRLSGKPLFPIEERPVPASDIEGEAASKTQPFPALPPSLAPQRITEADLWGATPEELEACRATFKTLRNEGIFTPPSLQARSSSPATSAGCTGAARHGIHRRGC